MKKTFLFLMVLTSISAFAKQNFTVEQKIISIHNAGSVANPQAQVVLKLTALLDSPQEEVTQSWVVVLKADGTLEEITKPSEKISAEYTLVSKAHEAAFFNIKTQYESDTESFQKSSSVFVKNNGDVQILD